MRRVSLKRARLNRQVNPIRDEYRAEFPMCQWCLEPATDLHEISRGAGRRHSLGVRAAWLHLCPECHKVMDWLPVAGQLALKRISDPFGYDRRRVNVLRGRAPESVTEAEVDKWVLRFHVEAA